MIRDILRYVVLNIKDRNIISRLDELKTAQFVDRNIVNSKQLGDLNKLLNHAYINVPYYRELLKKSGVVYRNKVSIKSLDQFSKLPMLTKDIIQHERDNMYSSDIKQRGFYRNSSGGSTGQPVDFIQDKCFNVNNLANAYLATSWRGVNIYESKVIFWGAERDTFEGRKPLTLKLKDFILNSLKLNTFVLSNNDIKNYIDVLNRIKPKLIVAYVQSIYTMALYARKAGLFVHKQNAIHAAAGTVHDFMRVEIEEVFGCKVFNHYGSREAGAIASECSAHDGMHIFMEHTLVEVIKDDGELCMPGEPGEILITTLHNYSMPLIRYKIGDIGVLSESNNCECGCSYPKLKTVLGRNTDIFKTASGDVVMPEYFIHLIGVVCNKGNIKHFQVIQHELNHIVVKIVEDGEVTKSNREEIVSKIKIVMGDNCIVDFDFVDAISKTKTGKYLYTISKL